MKCRYQILKAVTMVATIQMEVIAEEATIMMIM